MVSCAGITGSFLLLTLCMAHCCLGGRSLAAPALSTRVVAFYTAASGYSRCIDIPAGNTSPGTFLQQYDCGPTTSQTWKLVATDSNWYNIVSTVNPSVNWDIWGGDANSGDPVAVNGLNNPASKNQQFGFFAAGSMADGSTGYNIKIRYALGCVDINGAAPGNSVKVQQAQCQYSNGVAVVQQIFKVVPLYGPPLAFIPSPVIPTPPLSTRVVAFYTAASSFSRCIDIPAGNTSPGTFLQQYDCGPTTSQTWKLVATDSNWYNIMSQVNPSVNWDIWGGDANSGDPVALNGLNHPPSKNQQFGFYPVGSMADGSTGYNIKIRYALGCVDINGAAPGNSVKVQQAQCQYSNGVAVVQQIFNVVPTSGPPLGLIPSPSSQ